MNMSNPRIVAIVQARMSSTRLPGKTLMPLGGRTVLANVIARVQAASRIDAGVVATTTEAIDDPIVAEAARLGVPVFRGSRDDVLSRYLGAAAAYRADVVVRVTADCPLIDPTVIDRVVQALLEYGSPYASNSIVRSYPRGLDVEAFTLGALKEAAAEADNPEDREHVTLFFHRHPERYARTSVVSDEDTSSYRWTLDTEDDLRFLQEFFAAVGNGPGRIASFRELLDCARAHPEIAAINAGVRQKTTSLES
jgi:spore coat polysaccharide biosynthesis protein SpsF